MWTVYLGSPTRGRGGLRERIDADQPVILHEQDPGPWTNLTRWYLPNHGSPPKSLGYSQIKGNGKTLYLWIIINITSMPTSWGSPQTRIPSGPRKLMSILRPCMGLHFSPIGRTIGDSWSLHSRIQSKIVENRSSTYGWDPTTITQFLKSVSRNCLWAGGLSSWTPPECGKRPWSPYCGPSYSITLS